MKKILNLFALVLSFAFLASTASIAQFSIENNTDCTIQADISYGTSCPNVIGVVTVVVGPNSSTSSSFPAYASVYSARGGYLSGFGIFCPFGVDTNCTQGPAVNVVSCEAGCGNYSATLSGGANGIGSLVFN